MYVTRFQFSLTQLLMWTSTGAVLATILALLPSSFQAASAGIVTLLLFVIAEAMGIRRHAESIAPNVSYYSFAVAVAVATTFLFLLIHTPLSPGHFTDVLGQAMLMVLSYTLIFASLSLISFVAAIKGWSRDPSTKWLALLNLPGIILFGYCLLVIAIESLN